MRGFVSKKKLTALTLVIFLLISFVFPHFSLASDNYNLKIKEEMLESVWKQLEEQNETKFYPIFEQIIEDRFNEIDAPISTNSSAYIYAQWRGCIL